MDSLVEFPPLSSRYLFRRCKYPEMKLAQSFGFRPVISLSHHLSLRFTNLMLCVSFVAVYP
jgi:hypothetical protein